MPTTDERLYEHESRLSNHDARISVLEQQTTKMDKQIEDLTKASTQLLETTRTLNRWHWIIVTAMASGIVALALKSIIV